MANNLADVVSPDDDNANGWTTGIYTVVSPRSRDVVLWAGIAAHLTAHVPPAPCSGTRGVEVPVGIVAAVMMGPCFCVRRESAKQCYRRRDFTHAVVLHLLGAGCYRVAVPSEDAIA